MIRPYLFSAKSSICLPKNTFEGKRHHRKVENLRSRLMWTVWRPRIAGARCHEYVVTRRIWVRPFHGSAHFLMSTTHAPARGLLPPSIPSDDTTMGKYASQNSKLPPLTPASAQKLFNRYLTIHNESPNDRAEKLCKGIFPRSSPAASPDILQNLPLCLSP